MVNKLHPRALLVALIANTLLLTHNMALAQAKDSVTRLSFTMNLSSLVSDGTRSIKVQASRKVNKKNIQIDNLKSPFNLYLNEVKPHDPVDGTGWISKVFLSREGEGTFEFPADFYSLTAGMHTFKFIVRLESDPLYEDAQEELTVSDVKISLEYSGEDSIKTATGRLTAWKDSAFMPAPGVELKLCIKRTFNFLPFGEAGATTDSTGSVSGEVPPDIPGSIDGKLILAARLEDDETYGNVVKTSVIPWSVLPKVSPKRGRTLWSSGDNAPLLLVISSLLIIVLIWGTIFYLIYLLFKIKKLSKASRE